MARYRYDKVAGEVVSVEEIIRRAEGIQIIKDWEPYLSPLDFKTVLTSRSHANEHARANGCVIMGNDCPPDRYHGIGGRSATTTWAE